MSQTAALLALVLTAVAAPARATPLGPTAGVGLVATPNVDRPGFSLRPMSGPVAQVGLEVGDWLDSQFLFQFTNVSGPVVFPGLQLEARDRVQTLLGGYQLTLDVFGKQGRHGFTPFIGGGLFLGQAHVEVAATSSDPAVQQALVSSGAQQESRDGVMLELHAVAGLRYRLPGGVGVRAELGYSTYGGFIGTWQPKLGVDYAF